MSPVLRCFAAVHGLDPKNDGFHSGDVGVCYGPKDAAAAIEASLSCRAQIVSAYMVVS